MRTLCFLCALGTLLAISSSPTVVRAQDVARTGVPKSSIGYVHDHPTGQDPAVAAHEQALRRARRQTRGWAAGLVLSVGLMAAGTPLIVRGVQDSICLLSPCPDENRGQQLMAGGFTMVLFGLSGVLGSAFGLSAASKQKRRLERSKGRDGSYPPQPASLP